jgi:hypothetical protein
VYVLVSFCSGTGTGTGRGETKITSLRRQFYKKSFQKAVDLYKPFLPHHLANIAQFAEAAVGMEESRTMLGKKA